MIRELTRQNERLKGELDAAREKDGVFMPLSEFQVLDDARCTVEERATELEVRSLPRARS